MMGFPSLSIIKARSLATFVPPNQHEPLELKQKIASDSDILYFINKKLSIDQQPQLQDFKMLSMHIELEGSCR
jgi:hypothetical protein